MARKKPKILARKKSLADLRCPLCEAGVEPSYKDTAMLSQILTPRGKILARKRTGVCAKHQRKIGKAVKQARGLMLL